MNKREIEQWSTYFAHWAQQAMDGDTLAREVLEALYGETWERGSGDHDQGIEVNLGNMSHGNWQLFWEEGVSILYLVCRGVSPHQMTRIEVLHAAREAPRELTPQEELAYHQLIQIRWYGIHQAKKSKKGGQ